MLGLAYRDELRKRAKAFQILADALEEDDDALGALFTYEITLPTINVFLYALTHEPVFLKEQIKHLDDLVSKDELPSYYSTRLEIRELFECLKLLSPECLWIVLERLKSHHTTAIEELKNSVLQSNGPSEFELILDKYEINTDPITPISKLVFVQIRIDRPLEEIHKSYEDYHETDDDEIPDEQKELLLRVTSELGRIMEDLHPTQLSDNVGWNYLETVERTLLEDKKVTFSDLDHTFSGETFAKNHAKSIKKEHPEFDENGYTIEEFLDYKYRMTLLCYCVFVRNFSCLSTYAKVELEKLLKNKHYEPIWSEFNEFDSNAIEILEKGIDEFSRRHGLLVDSADETAGEEKGMQPTPRFEESSTQKESFKDAEPKEKAKVLCTIIQELLETNKERVEEFLGGYELCEVEGMIEAILTADAKEHTNIQREIIDDLSGTDHKNSSRYYYKDRLWLLPFFQIIGRLFKWKVLVGKRKQKAFVKALFPEMRCDKDPEFDVVYKEEFDFIETCRNRISKGNTGQPKEWKEKYEWIDKCCK